MRGEKRTSTWPSAPLATVFCQYDGTPLTHDQRSDEYALWNPMIRSTTEEVVIAGLADVEEVKLSVQPSAVLCSR